jgi:hypothetical protein
MDETLPHFVPGKSANLLATRTLGLNRSIKRFDNLQRNPLHQNMELTAAGAANCFFALMLFSSAAPSFAQGQPNFPAACKSRVARTSPT